LIEVTFGNHKLNHIQTLNEASLKPVSLEMWVVCSTRRTTKKKLFVVFCSSVFHVVFLPPLKSASINLLVSLCHVYSNWVRPT